LKEAVSALKEYQVILTRISFLEKELAHVPPEIKKLETAWQALTSQIEKYKSEQVELEQKCHKADVSLELEEQKSVKFEGDLSEVTNDKEYNAVLREIDTAKKEIGKYKELIKTSRAKINEIDVEIAEHVTKSEEAKAEFEKELNVYRTSQKAYTKELKELKKESQIVKETIPRGLLSKFNRIAERRNNVGLAFCQDSICKSCNVRVRHHIVEQLKMRDKVFQCESCRRILFYVEVEENK